MNLIQLGCLLNKKFKKAKAQDQVMFTLVTTVKKLHRTMNVLIIIYLIIKAHTYSMFFFMFQYLLFSAMTILLYLRKVSFSNIMLLYVSCIYTCKTT